MGSPPNKPLSPERVRSEERRRRIVELRIAGLSTYAIAQKLGISEPAVVKHLQKYLASKPYEQIEEVRRLELERIDRGIQVVMLRMAEGDLSAVDRLVKLIDLRMRILGGYPVQTVHVDQPIQLVWPDGRPVEVPAQIPSTPELTD